MGDPEPNDAYRALATPGEAKLKEKGSLFLAYAVPVHSREQSAEMVEQWRKRHYDATHVGWAHRLAPPPDGEERWDDDGEPHGSTGQPILNAIRGTEAWDVLVGVVRWYGGTKLGVGGLVRAYGGAAAMALEEASFKKIIPMADLMVSAPHDWTGTVYTLAERYGAKIGQPDVGSDEMHFQLTVARTRAEQLAVDLRDSTAGRATIEVRQR